jgi:sigma-E factor negative regulatory protein RseA
VAGAPVLAPALAPGPAPSAVVQVGDTAAAAEAPELVTNGRLVRDARLDRYLFAHQQFAGSSALGVPSAFLRSATATTDASTR